MQRYNVFTLSGQFVEAVDLWKQDAVAYAALGFVLIDKWGYML